MRITTPLMIIAVLVVPAGWSTTTQGGEHGMHHPGGSHSPDTRQLVHFPDELREHTLGNMRDHLLARQEINDAMARGENDGAARIAEHRLGLSAMRLHRAHENAKYMPQGMQDVGTTMHRSASRFAIEAQNGGVTSDLKPALQALSNVTAACVGCHSAYRLQ